MPHPDGFAVVEDIARSLTASSKPPIVVFVTAYPQFALQASEAA